jgi:predicted nucleotidyltransferase
MNKTVNNIQDIKKLINEIFEGKRVDVYIFGSRASGTSTPKSDLDLGFISCDDIGYELSVLREILEESNLTISVDIVDLSKVGKEFKRRVIKEGKLWISLRNN